MQRRTQVYRDFEHYAQRKDTRSMDAICTSSTGEFQLQVQQNFLRDYVAHNNATWRSLLLYHEIGSGKTCTAITVAEEHMRLNPGSKVRVILPARLRTNFLDELVSPCGGEAYLSLADYKLYVAPDTPAAVKRRIRKRMSEMIDRRYEILSFEKFKGMALKHKSDLKTWAREFTKDALVIVDEVHNLLSDAYDVKKGKEIVSTGVVTQRVKGMNTILFRTLTTHAHPSAKFLLLTATPIFDNISQLKELVLSMAPGASVPPGAKVADVLEHLRGKVSYFPGTSANAYPSVTHVTHPVPMSKTQARLTDMIISNEYDDLKEDFMAKQRQVSVACLQQGNSIALLLSNMREYCPKVGVLLKELQKPGKHVVYSNFVKAGLHVVEAALKRSGWLRLEAALKDPALWRQHEGKVYALWDGSVKDAEKQQIKQVVNRRDNLHGAQVRVVLGSPSVREGVSFKHVQHLHLLDPVWNSSAKTQVEGRAVRYCSHADIDEARDAPLKRSVTIHLYKSTRSKGDPATCDEIIYDDIIPRKAELVRAGEKALKRVALDFYLFRNLYKKRAANGSPPSQGAADPSPLGLKEKYNVPLRYIKKKKKTNSCPKPRRPDPATGECPQENMIAKKNPKGDLCCYKVRAKRAVSTRVKK